MIRTLAIAATAALSLAATAAQAEVRPREGGVDVRTVVEIAAPPERVWAAIGRPQDYWNSTHTWSGQASNLSMEQRLGGCFCERLADGGGVEHGRIVYILPNRTLRLQAMLGPLQELGVIGALTFELTPQGEGTRLTVSYVFGGLPNATATQLAPAVDGVIAEQTTRLERLVETGRAGA